MEAAETLNKVHGVLNASFHHLVLQQSLASFASPSKPQFIHLENGSNNTYL